MFFMGWKGINIGKFNLLLWMIVFIIFLGWRFFFVCFMMFLKVFFKRFFVLFIFLGCWKRWFLKVNLKVVFLIFIVFNVFFCNSWILKLFFLFLICIMLLNRFFCIFWMREDFLWKELFDIFWKLKFVGLCKLLVVIFIRFVWNEEFLIFLKLIFFGFDCLLIFFSNLFVELGDEMVYFIFWMFWYKFCFFMLK